MYFGTTYGARARGEEDGVRDRLAAQLGDDVDRAVADPDDQHPLAVEVERRARVDVVVRVDRRAVEVAGELGDRGSQWWPLQTSRRVEGLRRAVLERDQPAAGRARSASARAC
jgi:hypothetical protein